MASLTPQAFARRWSEAALSERSSYQQHFLDLCEMLDAPKPAEVDPKGEFYAFEKVVEKSGGGKGFADVWRKGFFAFEYKGSHEDLKAAYDQLLQYREDLQNPPLLVVTDTDRFEIHTNFTGTVKEVHAFTNAELPQEENLRVLRAMFDDPDSLRPSRTTEDITEEAAGNFALLADDVGLLPTEDLFTRVVERTGKDPERFARYAGELFGAMGSGGASCSRRYGTSTGASSRTPRRCSWRSGSFGFSWKPRAWTGSW